jgi:hypothetical protein
MANPKTVACSKVLNYKSPGKDNRFPKDSQLGIERTG